MQDIQEPHMAELIIKLHWLTIEDMQIIGQGKKTLLQLCPDFLKCKLPR